MPNKHSAPLEPGGDGGVRVLQTFGSAGAGRRWRGVRALLKKSSRDAKPGRPRRAARTGDFIVAGGAISMTDYKHSAQLEPGGDGGGEGATAILGRWRPAHHSWWDWGVK
jgi:hypothetical protein